MASVSRPTSPSLARSQSPPPNQRGPSSISVAMEERSSMEQGREHDPSHPLEAVASPFASSSRPSHQRARSSYTAMSSPGPSQPTLDQSTAPSTPQISPQRFWRPTTNLPFHVSQRHQVRRVTSDGAEEEHNRWLSEDEGLEGVARSIGRRRRRRSSSRSRGSGDEDHRSGRGSPGPSAAARSRGSSATKESPIQSAIAAIGRSKRTAASRPTARRARSFDAPVPGAGPPAAVYFDTLVGSAPPSIQDIIPPPSAGVQVVGLGLSNVLPDIEIQTPVTVMNATAAPVITDVVPDFSVGRGGDGISGISLPMGSVADDPDEKLSRRDRQKEMLGKLRRILGCALCPSSENGPPPLHRPITLPCGHTLSSEHISIPAPASLVLASDLAHEIAAAQQRQHQQRLNIWAGIMCPIPTCKRYSPQAGAAVVQEPPLESVPPTAPASSGAQRGQVLASGVAYFPPPVLEPPAYTQDAPQTSSTSPLLDICVEKTLQMVLNEMANDTTESDGPGPMREPSPSDLESTDDEDQDDHLPHTHLSQDLSGFGQSELSPIRRRMPKRRRNNTNDASGISRPSSKSPDTWSFRRGLASTLECDVCAMLLHEPVTTPCQHSFCAKCLSRSLDHSSRCPVCRQDLPSFAFFQDHAVNRVLLTIIKTAFPDEYAERQEAIEQDERDARLETPIFVCTLAFPGMPTILHIFEPRYRLMIRRCIESSSPRFGMLLPARATGSADLQGVSEYGTMLEIQSVQMLPDGRSMVETVGAHRFKLLEKGNLDGYTVGRIERIDDISAVDEASLEREAVARAAESRALAASLPAVQAVNALPGPPGVNTPLAPPAIPAEEAAQTTEEYMVICRAFIDQLRSGSAPWLLQRLNNTYGTMPTDPSEFSYWMALVIPIDEYEKARLLPIRSPRLRLKLIVHWVESLRSSWW